MGKTKHLVVLLRHQTLVHPHRHLLTQNFRQLTIDWPISLV